MWSLQSMSVVFREYFGFIKVIEVLPAQKIAQGIRKRQNKR